MYSFEKEKELLFLIELQDSGDGLSFVHVGQYERYDEQDVEDGSYACDKERFYLIQQMGYRGLIERRWETKDGFNLFLTPAGHDQILVWEYLKLCVWRSAHAVKTGHLLNRSG